jgi:hypothetical protein
MEHPFFSTDFAPIDFWLFPKINSALKGQRFKDNEDIPKEKVTMALKDITQQELEKCSQQ